MDETITMSKKEISRLEIMQKIEQKTIKQSEAANLMGISARQVKRIYRKYREKGAAGVISQRRGRPSNNQLDETKKQEVINLLHSRYSDFGPTLAREKILEIHGIQISTESVRQIQISEGLWKAKTKKRISVHQLRQRRACFGELIQLDGSPHAWFEDRGPRCTLLVFIDDATGKLVELFFCPLESFHNYAEATKRYFKRYGKPLAFYSDKHGIFRVNIKNSLSGSNLTQFGRAMKELDVEIICANTPQAKGRVEKANRTLQDRLVKEMRLLNISSIADANDFMPQFIQNFNQRFAVSPRCHQDKHRPLSPHDQLDFALSWQETRTLSKNLTLQFNKVVYQIQTKRPSYALQNAKVIVCQNAHNDISILYKGRSLDYTVFHQQIKQSQIISSKDIDHVLAKPKTPHRPAPDHPWRKSNPALVHLAHNGDIST